MGLLWTGGRRGEGQSRGSSQEATAATVAPAGRSSRGFLYGGGDGGGDGEMGPDSVPLV